MGTNALQDQIHLLSNVVYTSGTSLRDKASKEEGIKIVVESKLFPDVPVGKWYSNSIRYCANLGLITGYTKGSNAGKFGLNDTIKRGQIATILYRLEGSPEVVGESPFPDVQDSSKYYYDAAIWASQNEIVTGYTKGANAGKFGPNDDIKRQDLAVMLGRYAKYKGINITTEYSLDNFRDKNDVSGYAKNAPDTFIQYMIENGVITGKEKNIKDKNNVVTDKYFLIDPQATATRSQAATMVERFCHIILNIQ